jgi:hypothetical protein
MEKDITICIGTVGYPTFGKCFSIANKIAQKDPRVKDLIVIRNKYPTSAWLNQMRVSCSTTWCLQVDEDMYLYDDAIDELLKLAKTSELNGIKILNASSLLLDLFLKTNIGSLKLWNTKTFNITEFKDVQGSDRKFALDVSKYGFRNVDIKKVLGEHDSAPNIEIAYFKYKEYIMKIKNFSSEKRAKSFIKHLEKISNNRKRDLISKFALEGARAGLKECHDNKTKHYINNLNSDEIINVKKKLGVK